jgi:membrane protein involved in colicin uptake
MTRKLIATKSYSYATRRLKAGDEFDATDMHARILVGARKAQFAEDRPSAKAATAKAPVKIEEKAQAQAETTAAQAAETKATTDPLDDLRAQAHRLGIEIDKRWGAVRLQHEISKVSREPR